MNFSIIIPTKGRPTLVDTLNSVVRQLNLDDEIIVVTDGVVPGVDEIVDSFRSITPVEIELLCTPESHDNGASQRDYAITRSIGTHLLFMDDDDIFTHDAIDTIRKIVIAHPMLPHMFRMKAGNGEPRVNGWRGILWVTPKLTFGNVGTPMFVMPNLPYALMPKWAAFGRNSHDFEFIRAVASMYDNQIMWRPEVTSIIRPSEAEVVEETS